MKPAGLYIHFPFCRRRCFYCHFRRFAFHEDDVCVYLAALSEEIARRGNFEFLVDSIYFGGGSPSLLGARELEAIRTALSRGFRLTVTPEITLEANPEEVNACSLDQWLGAGINRLSIGVQSFADSDLRFLKRGHDARQGRLAVEEALACGFIDVNLDFIIGLPTQTGPSLARNLKQAAALGVSHLSVYILEGVKTGAAERQESRERRLYFQAREMLLALGYEHYEVSNYARPGQACRHNLKYWQSQPYVGLGVSAAGFENNIDYRNTLSLKRYRECLATGRLPVAKLIRLDPAQRRIVSGLRLLEGLPAGAFKPFPDTTQFLLENGFLERRGRNIAVPTEKILLLNEILSYFV